jgi:hypothetical protein
MKNTTQGIQIIGTQRSGSNLLRVILNQSKEIAAPHPPHILSTFNPLLHFYHTKNKNDYEQLVEDVLTFIKTNPVPWHDIHFDKKQIIANSSQQNIFELFKLIYEQAAKSKNAKYWCCKSMTNVHHAQELESNGIHPKYIFLFRDGRDMAVSFKKAVVGEKHAYYLAKQWKRDQEACLNLKEQIERQRFHSIRYEDLISKPEKEVKQLCQFLEIEYTEHMLSFHASRESITTAESGKMWINLTKPIIHNNYGKFLTELSDEELEIFELVAGDVLQRLDYKNITMRTNFDMLAPSCINRYAIENKNLKDDMNKNSKEDLGKRQDQIKFLESIKNRHVEQKPQMIL